MPHALTRLSPHSIESRILRVNLYIPAKLVLDRRSTGTGLTLRTGSRSSPKKDLIHPEVWQIYTNGSKQGSHTAAQQQDFVFSEITILYINLATNYRFDSNSLLEL